MEETRVDQQQQLHKEPTPEELDLEPFLSSIEDMERFKKSNVWRDILHILAENKIETQRLANNEKNVEEMLRYQGRLQELDYIVTVPDRIIFHIKGMRNVLHQFQALFGDKK